MYNFNMDINGKEIKIAFFGTPKVAVRALEELKNAGILPDLVVTAPDKPRGRKMMTAPPPAKVWALENGVRVEQPEKLSDIAGKLKSGGYDLFAVAAYGKIIPKEILEIPKHGTLNVHPSLLPRLRGASPIQSAILRGEKTGVTIMLMDEQMDHGPILAQRVLENTKHGAQTPNIYYEELEEKLAGMGGKLLAEVIPKWIAGEITPEEQEHAKATYCGKITKEDGLIKPDDSPETVVRKVRAFTPWPGAYFFAGGKRIIVTEAETENGALAIKRVKPEGKKEMPLADFLRGDKEAEFFLPKISKTPAQPIKA